MCVINVYFLGTFNLRDKSHTKIIYEVKQWDEKNGRKRFLPRVGLELTIPCLEGLKLLPEQGHYHN